MAVGGAACLIWKSITALRATLSASICCRHSAERTCGYTRRRIDVHDHRHILTIKFMDRLHAEVFGRY